MHKHLLDLLIAFEWDEGNADKSRRKHNVSIREAEEVFTHDPFLIFEDSRHSTIEICYSALGVTTAGRKLSLAFTIRNRAVRVISARPMSEKERKLYDQKQN